MRRISRSWLGLITLIKGKDHEQYYATNFDRRVVPRIWRGRRLLLESRTRTVTSVLCRKCDADWPVEVDSHLLEQISSIFGRKRRDQLLFGHGGASRTFDTSYQGVQRRQKGLYSVECAL